MHSRCTLDNCNRYGHPFNGPRLYDPSQKWLSKTLAGIIGSTWRREFASISSGRGRVLRLPVLLSSSGSCDREDFGCKTLHLALTAYITTGRHRFFVVRTRCEDVSCESALCIGLKCAIVDRQS